ncbi:MAG: 30S ribosomal protein S24e [Candidatus Helarchaeota archaeon]|nr:30S ribosomal protein S24e [Candidatus Helarchaeota archaeon]
MSSQLEITNETENLLLSRKQIRFKISHRSMATPSRADVRKKLAAQLNVEEDRVIIVRLVSKYGHEYTEGLARVYETAEKANQIEEAHLIKRHVVKAKKEEKTEGKGE